MARTTSALMERQALIVGILATCSVAAGCSRDVSERDIVGRYVASISGERQTLEIRSDGTYKNAFYENGKLTWQTQDRWTFRYEAPLQADVITFSHFRLGFKQYTHTAPGFWPVRPERSMFGRVEVCFDPDLNDRCFARQEN